MKLLIAYDGSGCAEAALDDLCRAGLPQQDVEAMVISVAEVWLPAPSKNESPNEYVSDRQTHPQFKARLAGATAVTEAGAFTNHAKNRLRRNFPKWKIEAEAASGSAASEIISRAYNFKPDLIVAGSYGHSVINRFLLGSISQKIVTDADCSVRVVRGRIEVDPFSVLRVLIGFDGLTGAVAAVESVAGREWPQESEFKLVAATDPVTPSAIGRFIPPMAPQLSEINESERDWIEKISAPSLQILKDAGLRATLQICPGNPKRVLVEEAERWNADAIFVGANRFGARFEGFQLGSVSSAVGARAHCSVEVVRKSAVESTGSSVI